MAVTITVDELRVALRLQSSDAEIAQATRLLAYATAAVEKHVPENLPDAIANEAVIRLSGYLFDQPNAGRGSTYANALRNSGAAAILLPYRIHRAGSTADAVEAAQQAVGTSGNPVTDVTVSGSTLTITFANGGTRTEVLPEGTGGGGIDQVARDAAAAAQVTADAAGGGSVIANTDSGRLPAVDVVMRIGWAQDQVVVDGIFTRADGHPLDGAAVGTVAGFNPPPFPPALSTDPDLYMFVWIAAPVAQVADLILGGGGGTLIGSGSAFASYTYLGTVGTVWVSNNRLVPGVSALGIRAVVSGALILTDGAVENWAKTDDATLIPVAKLANAPGGPGGDFAVYAEQRYKDEKFRLWFLNSAGLSLAAVDGVTGTPFELPYPELADAIALDNVTGIRIRLTGETRRRPSTPFVPLPGHEDPTAPFNDDTLDADGEVVIDGVKWWEWESTSQYPLHLLPTGPGELATITVEFGSALLLDESQVSEWARSVRGVDNAKELPAAKFGVIRQFGRRKLFQGPIALNTASPLDPLAPLGQETDNTTTLILIELRDSVVDGNDVPIYTVVSAVVSVEQFNNARAPTSSAPLRGIFLGGGGDADSNSAQNAVTCGRGPGIFVDGIIHHSIVFRSSFVGITFDYAKITELGTGY